jgi:hypothetical protein
MQGLRPAAQSWGRGSRLYARPWPPLTLNRFGFARCAVGERGRCCAQGSGTAIAIVRSGRASSATKHRSSEDQTARRNEDELVHPHRDHPRGDSAYVKSHREPYSSRGAEKRANDYQGSTRCRHTHTHFPPDLRLTPDCAQSAARLVARGIASQRFTEGGLGGRGVAFQKADVAPKDSCPCRVRKYLLVESEQSERVVVLSGATNAKCSSVERSLAKVVRVTSVESLAKRTIRPSCGVGSRGECGVGDERREWRRLADAAMTGRAAHLEPRRRATLVSCRASG